MTSNHPTQTVRGAETGRVSRPEQVERLRERRRSVSMISARLRAVELQRKGMTMSEIAERLDLRRAVVVNILYWEKIRDV